MQEAWLRLAFYHADILSGTKKVQKCLSVTTQVLHLKIDQSTDRVDSLIFYLSLQNLRYESGRSVILIFFLNFGQKCESYFIRDVLLISYTG